jgi:hypothetical protein
MSLLQNCIATINPSPDIGFLLAATLSWDFVVWLFVAVPWPAPLIIMLLWKCFGFAPTAQRMRAHFCTVQAHAPQERSVTLGLVLIFWPLSLALRWLLQAGRKDTGLWGVIGTVERAKVDE